MKILFVGIKSSGKGTQAKLLSEKLKTSHISSGDLFRDIDRTTKLGEIIRSYIDKGSYVPDELTNKLVTKRLEKEDCKNGFILDGFPKTLEQAKFLNEKHKFDYVIVINIDRKEALRRISGRRVCPKCDISYNIYTAPKPKKENICNKCGSKLFTREDESEEASNRRIDRDIKEMKPMLNFYKDKKIVIEINGEQPIENVHHDILKKLGIR